MIKSIELDFPDYKVKQSLSFTSGINVVEKPNGWGKTTMINTLLSLYTGYFGVNTKIPNGYAKIEDDKGSYVLNKRMWVGATNADPLARYSIVGSFFNDLKTTPQQREVFTKLLGIDMNEFIFNEIQSFIKEITDEEVKYFADLNVPIYKIPELKKTLSDKLKQAKADEKIILEDIQRYKTTINGFKERTFPAIDTYNKALEDLDTKVVAHNKSQDTIVKNNQKIQEQQREDIRKLSNLENNLVNLNKELEQLRIDYCNTNSVKCFHCAGAMKPDEKKLKHLITLADSKKLEISKCENDIKVLKAKKYDLAPYQLLSSQEESLKHFKITLPIVTQEQLDEYNNYLVVKGDLDFTKKELSVKEEQLKKINTTQISDCISNYDSIVLRFNEVLESEIKETGLNVELFKTHDNGNVSPTFSIYNDDGIEYDQCSHGAKMMIQIKMALIFVKKFKFDFIIIDEASSISKTNIEILEKLLKGYQVLLFKAESWDIKSKEKKTTK